VIVNDVCELLQELRGRLKNVTLRKSVVRRKRREDLWCGSSANKLLGVTQSCSAPPAATVSLQSKYNARAKDNSLRNETEIV
jgi:hypothetical protein